MSKTIVMPRLRGITTEDHSTLVSSFQTIQPAIDSGISEAVAKLPTLQQVFALSQKVAALTVTPATTTTITSSTGSGSASTPTSSSTFQLVATTGAFILVRESASGVATIVDNTVDQGDSILGLTQTAGPAGAKVPVSLDGSLVANVAWAWTPASPVFASTAGALTQTVPATGYRCLIGYAVSATTVLLQIGEPIFLNVSGALPHGVGLSATGELQTQTNGNVSSSGTPTAGQYAKWVTATTITGQTGVPNTDVTGLGTMSTQNANAVAITGGNWTAAAIPLIGRVLVNGAVDDGTSAGQFNGNLYATGNGTFGTATASNTAVLSVSVGSSAASFAMLLPFVEQSQLIANNSGASILGIPTGATGIGNALGFPFVIAIAGTQVGRFSLSGFSVKTTASTAYVTLGAGTAAPSTSPLKFTTGTNLTTPEDGAFEYDGTHLYFTIGATRHTIV